MTLGMSGCLSSRATSTGRIRTGLIAMHSVLPIQRHRHPRQIDLGTSHIVILHRMLIVAHLLLQQVLTVERPRLHLVHLPRHKGLYKGLYKDLYKGQYKDLCKGVHRGLDHIEVHRHRVVHMMGHLRFTRLVTTLTVIGAKEIAVGVAISSGETVALVNG